MFVSVWPSFSPASTQQVCLSAWRFYMLSMILANSFRQEHWECGSSFDILFEPAMIV